MVRRTLWPAAARFTHSPRPRSALTPSNIRGRFAIAQPNEREIWLGTYGGGISVVNAKNGQVVEHIQHDKGVDSTINSNMIGSMLTDVSGLLWIGTWAAGLNLYDASHAAFRTLHHSPYAPTRH